MRSITKIEKIMLVIGKFKEGKVIFMETTAMNLNY